MKINLKGLLTQAANEAGGHFRHTLPELYENMVELRTRTLAGDMGALDEFFALYVVDEQKAKATATSSLQPEGQTPAP